MDHSEEEEEEEEEEEKKEKREFNIDTAYIKTSKF
jgi:hypothetical protein